MLKLLDKNKDTLDMGWYLEIRNKVIASITAENDAFIKRSNLANYYVLYSDPSIENGYMSLNIKKLEQVINYIAERVTDLRKVLP